MGASQLDGITKEGICRMEQGNAKKFEQCRSNHVYDIVTSDETLINCYEPESKRQSAQQIVSGEVKPTKARRGRSTGRKMVASFFSRRGHIVTVALEDHCTINLKWYVTTCLPKVLENVRERRP